MNETALTTSNSTNAILPKSWDEINRFADKMAQSDIIPTHLQKKPANCMRIIMQAVTWEMNPFAVADCSSFIKGRIFYEGKLVHAVADKKGIIKDGFTFTYKDLPNDDIICTVSATLSNRDKPDSIEVQLSKVRTENNKNWKNNPKLQLSYKGVRDWIRMYKPSLMEGVYTTDEAEEFPEPKEVKSQTDMVNEMTDDPDNEPQTEEPQTVDFTEATEEEPQEPQEESPSQEEKEGRLVAIKKWLRANIDELCMDSGLPPNMATTMPDTIMNEIFKKEINDATWDMFGSDKAKLFEGLVIKLKDKFKSSPASNTKK